MQRSTFWSFEVIWGHIRSPLESERNDTLSLFDENWGLLPFLIILVIFDFLRKKMNFKLMELLNEYSRFWFRAVYILEPKRIWTVPAHPTGRDFNSRILRKSNSVFVQISQHSKCVGLKIPENYVGVRQSLEMKNFKLEITNFSAS